MRIFVNPNLDSIGLNPSSDDETWDDDIDWGEEADEEIACGIENPESCESCQ